MIRFYWTTTTVSWYTLVQCLNWCWCLAWNSYLVPSIKKFLFCSNQCSHAETPFSCSVFRFQDGCSSQFQVCLREWNESKLTSLCILTCLLFELVKSFIELTFNLLFHLRHLDLIVVFEFGYFLLGANTVLIPFKTLDFINRHFFKDVLHWLHVLLQLVHLHVAWTKLLVSSFPQLRDLRIFFHVGLVQWLLRNFFSLVNFVLKLKHQFHVFCILVCQWLYKYLTVFDLSFELFDESEVVTSDSEYFFLFVGN